MRAWDLRLRLLVMLPSTEAHPTTKALKVEHGTQGLNEECSIPEQVRVGFTASAESAWWNDFPVDSSTCVNPVFRKGHF